jgi:hypothetical protein
LRTTVASADIGDISLSLFSSPAPCSWPHAACRPPRSAGQIFDLIGRGVFQLTELLLDRLHLLVQIVLALILFHLAFDAPTDALFHLEQIVLGFHQAHQMLEPGLHVDDFQHALLFVELERHVRGHGIGEPAGVVDAGQRGEHLRRHLFVELDVLIEQHHR